MMLTHQPFRSAMRRGATATTRRCNGAGAVVVRAAAVPATTQQATRTAKHARERQLQTFV